VTELVDELAREGFELDVDAIAVETLDSTRAWS